MSESGNRAICGKESQSLPLPPCEPIDFSSDLVKALFFAVSELQTGRQKAPSTPAPYHTSRFDELVTSIRTARKLIAENRFRIALQPIVCLGDNQLHHYEALARFNGGDCQSSFIGFLEKADIIHEFDRRMVNKVIQHISRMSAEPVPIAVNLSSTSLSNESIIRDIEGAVRQDSSLGMKLIIELTETVRISDFAHLNNNLQRLRQLGVKTCIDDFGSGSTSFQSLTDLKVDIVKLDGNYLHKIDFGDDRDGFLSSVIKRCQAMGARIVAEKIETGEQARKMKAMGVDLGQGYFFGRPEMLTCDNG
ncbi:EAL domain-containing protein [Aestuariispira insulae]|uniref:EAL domain-containing protein (Putative c-di-GMP-specific phosphodiesterase class I) n=1 Tax=Aestuariispira insulae TaxID=1461337 RepID=A0A3D9H2L9_9PROT|nr:EAL domain-containing protein [Aestuariispira insulae]RED43722.1 EAL domain-containing protein (putative c-di-GMP-specific phosphodiesterase class I) [Aestuariispira insulae]